MTEEQTQKKPGRIKRFLKGLFLTILALLLIAGIFLQAPPKVLALLTIILATITIVPKPAIKYIRLTFAAIAIGLIIWVFLPDDSQNWKPYTFEEDLATLEAERAIPNDQNAAIIYNELMQSYEEIFAPDFFDDPDLEDLIGSQPWSSNDYPEVANWLKTHQNTIEMLIKASKKENCRFPIYADVASLDKSMERLGPIKRWARLLLKAANNDLGDGRIDDAIKKQIAVLQMAKHLYQQSTSLDMLVGIAIEALGTHQLNTFLVTDDATEKRLAVIEKTLKSIKHDWSSGLPKMVDVEKLLLKNMSCGLFYEINIQGKIRINRNPMAVMMSQLPPYLQSEISQNYWQIKLAKAVTILNWFWIPSTPRKAAEIIDSAYEKYYAMAHPDFDRQKPAEETPPKLRLNYQTLVQLMAGMTEETYHKIHDLYSRVISENKATQIIIALRRYKNQHGQWPESLDEIRDLAPAELFIDPVNNDSFVYKLTDDNFTLYSKGKNNIDENGIRNKIGEDDLLIWPVENKSRKTNKNSDKTI